MRKWEYSWDTIEAFTGIVKHVEFLKERGLESWELVSTVVIKEGSVEMLRFYWKREIINN